MASRHAIAERHRRILAHCRDRPHTAAELAERVGTSQRTTHKDLERLRERFGERLQTTDDGWVWTGRPPHRLGTALTHLDHLELIALVTARGVLHDPSRGDAGAGRYGGLLAEALDELLDRCGLREEAAAISPTTVAVSRFAALVEEPLVLAEAVEALQAGDALRGRYRNLAGEGHPVHLLPVRLVLHGGEWCLLANDGRREPAVKVYRLARFDALRAEPRGPAGQPPREQLATAAEALLASAYRSTGVADPAARERVTLAVAPTAVPHFRDRSWGLDQTWDDHPADLPPGWARLAYTTSGLAHARHELLGHGTAVIAEAPDHLRRWLATEAAAVAASYDPAPASKTPGAERRKNGGEVGQDGGMDQDSFEKSAQR